MLASAAAGRRVALLIGFAVTAAVAALAMTPRAACACSTKTPAYIANLKAELRVLGRFQRDFAFVSGRMASRRELEEQGWAPSPSSVALATLEITDSTLYAVSTSPTYLPGASCTMSLSVAEIRDDPYADDLLLCAGLPDARREERRATVVYVALFVVAVLVRVAVAGRSRPPIGLGTAGGFLALGVLHPFWFLWNDADWCDRGVSTAFLWLAFLVAYILRTALLPKGGPPAALESTGASA